MKRGDANGATREDNVRDARHLWEQYRALTEEERDSAFVGSTSDDDLESALTTAESFARNGDKAHAVRALLDLVRERPDVLAGRLAAIQKLVTLGEDALALQLLDDTEERFQLESTEFARIIRAEIRTRHPRPDAIARSRLQQSRHDALSTALASKRTQTALPGNPARTAHIYTVTFMDFAGQRVYPGGAERYIFDLAKILDELGLSVVVYQGGNEHWTRQIGNIRVVAIPWRNTLYQLSVDFGECTAPAAVNIYSPFTLAVAWRFRPSIGICHGVYWDHEGFTLFNDDVRRDVFSALLHLDECISVDANSVNVIRASRPELAKTMSYVPNYVGEEFFLEPRRDPARVRLLFPRRLYGPRGYWLLAEIVPDLIEEHPNLDFVFVGDSDEKERKHVTELVARFPSRVRHVVALPQEMTTHYQAADITVIPTVASEGTSLSALEALAAGSAVIATDVGGLSNVVIDGHNGLLVSPTAADLRMAINTLVTRPALRKRLQREGRRSARAFSKGKWSSSWKRVLDKHVEGRNADGRADRTAPRSVPRIIHPVAGGIVWTDEHQTGLPRQRPHHLAQALAMLGANVSFCEDASQTQPLTECDGRWEVLGKDALVYAEEGVYFVYYAYMTWLLGDVADDWAMTLPAEVRGRFVRPKTVHAIENAKVWFDLIDDPAIHADEFYEAAVHLFLRHADYVTTSSRVLQRRYAEVRPDIVLVENACWPADFSQGRPDEPSSAAVLGEIDEVRAGGQHVIGYVGAIARWFDFAVLERLSGERPSDLIVLAGPIASDVTEEVDRLRRAPNVIVTGAVPYEAVPSIVTRFDVAILPFKPNDITDATNPLKVYEYLAADVPVVTTDLQELRDIVAGAAPPYLRICSVAGDLVREVGLVLDQLDQRELPRTARWFAMENNWLARASVVLGMLGERVTEGGAHADGEPFVFDSAAMRFGRSATNPARPVGVADSFDVRTVSFGDDDVEVGDTLHLSIPVYVTRDGYHRLVLRLVSVGGPLLGMKWTVTIGEGLVWTGQERGTAGGMSVIAICSLLRGLNTVIIELTAQHAKIATDARTGFIVEEIALRSAPFSSRDSLKVIPITDDSVDSRRPTDRVDVHARLTTQT